MLRVNRREHVMRDDSVTLVSREWSAMAGVRRFAAGATYVRPSRVLVGEMTTLRITDHVMALRLVLLLAVVSAAIWRGRRD